MLEIAALAFNKIVLLFFYNIKHLKFQSSNTMIIDQTRIHTSITELLECNIKNLFFYTSFNLSATYYNFSWRTDKENERLFKNV